MKYAEILDQAITNADLSLAQICRRVSLHKVHVNASYLSKLKNDKVAPASDRLNEALAKVLGIETIELKTAAYISKLPSDVVERIKCMGYMGGRANEQRTDSAG